MIWLSWRQHRRQALFALIGMAVLAGVLVPTGQQMYDALGSTGLADCLRTFGASEFVHIQPGETCDGATEKFNNAYGDRAFFAVLLVFLPLLVGMFWGAPLVARETEHNTHRLVWTQGVTRLHWSLVKFAALIGAAAIVSASYALLTSWWIRPITQAGTGRFDYLLFDIQGVAPIGYTLFAVALGICVGTVTRKVLPAMAVTFVAFLGTRIVVAAFVRPHLQSPLVRKYPVVSDTMLNPNLGDWITSYGIYDGKGNLIAANTSGNCHLSEADVCGGLDRFNIQTYQPGSRFWLFQYLETGIFIAVAALLLYLGLRNVRRRIA